MSQMVSLHTGMVVSVVYASADGAVQELDVEVGGVPSKAVNYTAMTGVASAGDTVVLNTTAVELGLGTGGRHFVVHVAGKGPLTAEGPGHIMKLRYTPMQLRCLSVEEDDSPWHDTLRDADSIGGMPVVVAGLHSMVPAIAAGIRTKAPEARIAYVMTDGASLPAAFSRLIPRMKELGLIDACITSGHSFGGDMEAVNTWTALLAARHCVGATHAIVAMGPGIVGTGTRFGFTGMEQSSILNAVHCLDGKPIAVLRVGFADTRERHRGISHHSITALGKATMVRASIGIPVLPGDERSIVMNQLESSGLAGRHDINPDIHADDAVDACASMGIRLSTMGRGVDEERAFFLCAAAGGILAAVR